MTTEEKLERLRKMGTSEISEAMEHCNWLLKHGVLAEAMSAELKLLGQIQEERTQRERL